MADNDLADSIFVYFTYINILASTVILRKYYKFGLGYYIIERERERERESYISSFWQY